MIGWEKGRKDTKEKKQGNNEHKEGRKKGTKGTHNKKMGKNNRRGKGKTRASVTEEGL
jgi:hypothetical protein